MAPVTNVESSRNETLLGKAQTIFKWLTSIHWVHCPIVCSTFHHDCNIDKASDLLSLGNLSLICPIGIFYDVTRNVLSKNKSYDSQC